jgi:RNA polymerase sigma factor (sigma-70 family)
MDSADVVLVERALAGDRSAFGALVALHRPLLVGFLASLLGDAAEAEDVAQEACLAAYLGLERLRDHARFSTWLTGIGLNLARMRLRTRARNPGLTWEDLDGGRAVPGFNWSQASPSAEAVAEARQAHAAVLRAIQALPPELSRAVRQHYLEGLSIAEVAMLAEVPAGTIKARLHRARGRLRMALAPVVLSQPASHADRKELAMIEMRVQSVVQRTAPHDEAAPHYGRPHRVVLLKEAAGQRMLSIWVGPWEGDNIALLLAQKATVRPMAYELVARVLEAGQMKLQRAAVTRLDDDIFYAALHLEAHGSVHEVDARPSDALAVALRAGAPVFVDGSVLEKVGVSPDDWEAKLETQLGPDQPTAAWQPVSADDILERWRWKPKGEQED